MTPDVNYYRRAAIRRGYADGFSDKPKTAPPHHDELDATDIELHYNDGHEAGTLDRTSELPWHTSLPEVREEPHA